MRREKGVLGSRIQVAGARNPNGWSPESRWLEPGIQIWLEPGIQMVGARNLDGWSPESR